MRRRHLEASDGSHSSPFARDRFALRPPEEQEAVIAKRRAQRLAAEALDAQLADRSGSTSTSSSSSPQRPARRSPGNSSGASSVREPRDAQPRLDSRPVTQRSPERKESDDQVAWWHEPEARRRSPPPRRRSGRELLRDPEESLLREAERIKKLEVGEALRAQMQEREQHQTVAAHEQHRAGPPRALQKTVDVVEAAVQVVSPNDRSEEDEPVNVATQSLTADTGGTWESTSVFHERLARLEYQLGWSQAGQRSSAASSDIGVVAQELRAEMATIHDAHKTLNADLDAQVQFLAHLDESVKSLQEQIPSKNHDATNEQTNHTTQVMVSLRHDVDQLLAERSKTKTLEEDLDVRLASTVEDLRHELADDMSRRYISTAEAEIAHSVERFTHAQEKQTNDHLLLAEQVAKLESVIAQQVGLQAPRPHERQNASDDSDDATLRSKNAEAGTSGVEELRQDMERRFELSAAALDEVSRHQSAVSEEIAVAYTAALSKEDVEALLRDLSTISGRVEALEQTRDDHPSLSELSDKLNELVEKQWELDQSDALRALEDSVHTCMQDTAATAAELQSQSSAVAESIALSRDVPVISRRVDALERGREGDLAQLFEKLNVVEEKSWDEQAVLAEQIAALESKLAIRPGGSGS